MAVMYDTNEWQCWFTSPVCDPVELCCDEAGCQYDFGAEECNMPDADYLLTITILTFMGVVVHTVFPALSFYYCSKRSRVTHIRETTTLCFAIGGLSHLYSLVLASLFLYIRPPVDLTQSGFISSTAAIAGMWVLWCVSVILGAYSVMCLVVIVGIRWCDVRSPALKWSDGVLVMHQRPRHYFVD